MSKFKGALESFVLSLYHDKYSITLARVSMMLDKGDINMTKRFPALLPRRWTAEAYNYILLNISIMMSKREISIKANEQLLKIAMYNKINNILPALFYGLTISKKPPAEMLEYFKNQYGDYPKSAGDFDLILSDIKRLSGKYAEIFADVKGETPAKEAKLNFEKLILSLEITLERAIDRNCKLYQLEQFYDAAVERVKAQEKMLQKYKH